MKQLFFINNRFFRSNIFLLLLIVFFGGLILYSLLFDLSFKEGLSPTIIPIKAKIVDDKLYLDKDTYLSIGDTLQINSSKPVLNTSGKQVSINSGSGKIYTLSDIVDPKSVVYDKEMDMQISTNNPKPEPPPLQIQINGIIESSSNILNIIGAPSSPVEPDYLLLGSASNQLKDKKGKPLKIKSMKNTTTAILSDIPNQDYIVTDEKAAYIIEAPAKETEKKPIK